MTNSGQFLTGGNVAASVIRIGDTVRKPATQATSSIEAFLTHLQAVGFTGAPRTLGRDEQDRHILEYIPGTTIDMNNPLSIADLQRLGRLIRELHTASATFTPPTDAQWQVAIQPDAEDLICHHDLAPWNLVIDKQPGSQQDRWVFIDWDGSGQGSRLWDLTYAAQSFCPLIAGGDPESDAKRLIAVIDGYGLDADERALFPRLLTDRTAAMYQLLLHGSATGQQPWARLYADGHGTHWKQAADYIRDHQNVWLDGLLQA